MMRNLRFRGGTVVLGLSLALAGCRNSDGPSGQAGLFRFGATNQLSPAATADVQVAFGRSLEKQGQFEQAGNAYQQALKKDPSRSDAYVRLAILNDRQGRFAESAELYRKALKAQPGSADIYCNMGYSLYLQHRWDEAEMNLAQAIALNPNHRRAHNNLGLVLAQKGRPNEALAEFRKGGCPEADAQANVAFGLTLARRWPEARGYYESALLADPQSPAARQGLQQLDVLMAKADSPQATLSPRFALAQQEPKLLDAGIAKSPSRFTSPYGSNSRSSSYSLMGSLNSKEGTTASTSMKPAPEVTTKKTPLKISNTPASERSSGTGIGKIDQSPPTPVAKVQYNQTAKTGQNAKVVPASLLEPLPSQPYVTRGTIVVPDAAAPAPKPAPKAAQLKQRIADSCAIPRNKVELRFMSDTEVEVELTARDQNEANVMARRVLLLPELHPYRVDVKVNLTK